MPFNLKYDGTPNSSKSSLCDNCRMAQVTKGSNGEKMILCQLMPFTHSEVSMRVTQCNKYLEVNRQTLQEMEQSAWLLGTKKIVGLAGGVGEETQVMWSKPEDRKEERTLQFHGQRPR